MTYTGSFAQAGRGSVFSISAALTSPTYMRVKAASI
jgi:hypothetical protein